MKKMNIYVEVTHFDFWWGILGFCNKTSWEDVILYRKWGNGYRDNIFLDFETTIFVASIVLYPALILVDVYMLFIVKEKLDLQNLNIGIQFMIISVLLFTNFTYYVKLYILMMLFLPKHFFQKLPHLPVHELTSIMTIKL